MKHWPTDLVFPGLAPPEAEIFTIERGSFAHSLSLSSAHGPDITEILLKRI